jgi:ubiquinone/menaquinone biosynthesis C-methylase UbiE
MKEKCPVVRLSSFALLDDVDPVTKKERIVNYYEKAGRDYYAWSSQYNMHFGFYRWGMNPFARETMLDQLNWQVLERLKLNSKLPQTCVDFGCGLGTTLRHGGKHFPNVSFKGITIVPWQVDQARKLNKEGGYKSIEIIEADYCRTPLETNSVDAVYAIESSCYATGDTKFDLLSEIHRVLKPGGRFVIADGFVKEEIPPNRFLHRIYQELCSSWALTELGNIVSVEQQLRKLNFANIEVEDVSMNIAPSVVHVPFTVLLFLINELLFGKEKMTKERWGNLKSPLLTMILGLARRYFGYYFVSGLKH